jgi:hypothetical protein
MEERRDLTFGNIYVELQKARLGKDSAFHLAGCHTHVALVERLKNAPVDDLFRLLGERIALLREQDFDYYYTDESGRKVLIKDNINVDQPSLNPIHRYEALMQMYRYMRGALLIIENAEPKERDKLYTKIKYFHDDLFFGEILSDKNAGDMVLRFAEKLTDLLAVTVYPSNDKDDANKNAVDLENMRMQFTMARDLGILLEDQPVVCTVSQPQGSNAVSVERATLAKISPEYYEQSMMKYPVNRPWFAAAKRFAGLDVKDKKTWLDYFFENHFKELAERGVPIPPSARWLPIPANTQLMETVCGTEHEMAFNIQQELSFVRTGIIIPYDIRDVPGLDEPYTYQKEIAVEIMKQVIRQYLEQKIAEFKLLYLLAPEEKFDFYISYQTLLTPLPLEKSRDHVDNNARFVAAAKEAVLRLSQDSKFISEMTRQTGANLIFCQTNSAVNRNAPVAVNHAEDMEIRKRKIKRFEDFYASLRKKPNFFQLLKQNPKLASEINLRKAACQQLKSLIAKENPYNKLKDYQYNFMMAALDNIVMGHQALSIDGCKSTRDRTGVFGCALRTMLQNPEAMSDWKTLRDGIVQSLLEGHYFRSVGYSSGVVKVDLVHKDFLKAMRQQVRKDIKELLVFSKSLPAYTDDKQKLSPPNVVKGLGAEVARLFSGGRREGFAYSPAPSRSHSRSPSSSSEESDVPPSPPSIGKGRK